MPLMGVSPARIFVGPRRSAARSPPALPAGAAVRRASGDRPVLRPITFLICVMGGLGSMAGGFIAAFVFAQFISVGGFLFHLEWGYVLAFAFFIAMMFWRAGNSRARYEEIGNYPLHLMILVLLWGYIYTSWSLMGAWAW